MGMPEYRDGRFGPIKPLDDSLRDLLDNPVERERTKALHIGRVEELTARLEAPSVSEESEPLARILQGEFSKLRLDVNRIMAHLGFAGD